MNNIRKYLLIGLIGIQIILVCILYFKPDLLLNIEKFQLEETDSENQLCPTDGEFPTNIDAIFSGPEGKIHVFKASCYWLYDNNFTLVSNYPKPINTVWGADIPNDLNSVFEMNGYVYFIYADKVWKSSYFTKEVIPGWEMGIPISRVWKGLPNNIDAIYYNNYNIGCFKADKLYRYVLDSNQVSNNTKLFKNCPDNIDACFIYNEDYIEKSRSKLYVFKGDRYYRINLDTQEREKAYPDGIPISIIKNPPNVVKKDFSFTGQAEKWNVPKSGMYRIIAYGASAGYGGKGARMCGDFKLNKKDELSIIVGGQGKTICSDTVNYKCNDYFLSSNKKRVNGSSGGGSTKISVKTNTGIKKELLVAGGGGGWCNVQYSIPEKSHATIPSITKNETESKPNVGGISMNIRYMVLISAYDKVVFSNLNIIDSDNNNLININNKKVKIIQGLSNKFPVGPNYKPDSILDNTSTDATQVSVMPTKNTRAYVQVDLGKDYSLSKLSLSFEKNYNVSNLNLVLFDSEGSEWYNSRIIESITENPILSKKEGSKYNNYALVFDTNEVIKPSSKQNIPGGYPDGQTGSEVMQQIKRTVGGGGGYMSGKSKHSNTNIIDIRKNNYLIYGGGGSSYIDKSGKLSNISKAVANDGNGYVSISYVDESLTFDIPGAELCDPILAKSNENIKQCHQMVNNQFNKCPTSNLCWDKKTGKCYSPNNTPITNSIDSLSTYRSKCISKGDTFCLEEMIDYFKLFSSSVRSNKNIILSSNCGILWSGVQYLKIPISSRVNINRMAIKLELIFTKYESNGTITPNMDYVGRQIHMVNQYSSIIDNKYQRFILYNERPVEDVIPDNLHTFPHGINNPTSTNMNEYNEDLIRLGIKFPTSNIPWNNGWKDDKSLIRVGCVGGCSTNDTTSIFDNKDIVYNIPINGSRASFSLGLKSKWVMQNKYVIPKNLYLNLLIPGDVKEYLIYNIAVAEYDPNESKIDINNELNLILAEHRKRIMTTDPMKEFSLASSEEESYES